MKLFHFSTGDFKFLKEVKSPWKCKIFIEKFDRGQWNIAIINRKVDDICPSLQNPSEPWYDFFSKFHQKNCPFAAGHVETFKNYSVHTPDYIPRNFMGQYRATTSFEFEIDGKVHHDCVRLSLEIIDAWWNIRVQFSDVNKFIAILFLFFSEIW